MNDIFINGILAMGVSVLVWCLWMGNKKVKTND